MNDNEEKVNFETSRDRWLSEQENLDVPTVTDDEVEEVEKIMDYIDVDKNLGKEKFPVAGLESEKTAQELNNFLGSKKVRTPEELEILRRITKLAPGNIKDPALENLINMKSMQDENLRNLNAKIMQTNQEFKEKLLMLTGQTINMKSTVDQLDDYILNYITKNNIIVVY